MKKLIGLVCLLLLACPAANADVILGGYTTPDTAVAWENPANGSGVVGGDAADGSLTASLDSDIYSYGLLIGGYAGFEGEVTITGSGSSLTNGANDVGDHTFNIGYSGTGFLTIADHATVTSVGAVSLARASGSAGTLDISGGSTLTCHRFFGAGGANTSSTVTVSGDGSSITAGEHMYIGSSGTGTLDITDGGSVTNVCALVGLGAGSSGTVTVSGEGSSWLCDCPLQYAKIGENGTGTLNITEGGLVTINGPLHIDFDSGNTDDSFVNMSTGGMLAMPGTHYDLTSFFTQILGDGDIRYWDGSAWDSIGNATLGEDYTLVYDGSTYTTLTVGTPTEVPEPSSVVLLLSLLATIGFFCKKK